LSALDSGNSEGARFEGRQGQPGYLEEFTKRIILKQLDPVLNHTSLHISFLEA
jgi:hypothetical protein